MNVERILKPMLGHRISPEQAERHTMAEQGAMERLIRSASYELWLHYVDEFLGMKTDGALSSEDFNWVPFRQWFDSGIGAARAARQALRSWEGEEDR